MIPSEKELGDDVLSPFSPLLMVRNYGKRSKWGNHLIKLQLLKGTNKATWT